MPYRIFRIAILNNPELFLDHSINGELDKECELLKKEYIEIIRMAKYKYIEIS